jgi:polyadenylation factor subunit 2
MRTVQGEVRGAHEAGITALAWHPEGHVVCTGSSDHMLRFWARPRPGDGVDHFQAAMRRQEAGEGVFKGCIACYIVP